MSVIKQSDRPQFFNQRIGINRFDTNSQEPWEAISNAAGNVASIAIKKLYDNALESGETKGQAANLIITDAGGAPKALTPPKNLSPTEQKAYQNIVNQRYLFNINNALKNKSLELKTKHPYDVNAFSKAFSTFADGLAKSSGEKWGGRVNDIAINMLAMNKLDIESSTSTKIFEETKENSINDIKGLIGQVSEYAKMGQALSDPDDPLNVPIGVAHLAQLNEYLKTMVEANFITTKEAQEFKQEAITNMALGSVDILLNKTQNKIQRDILESFIISGDSSGFNLLPDGMANNLIELKQYVNSNKGGNLGEISSRITKVRNPLDDKEAFVLAENEKIRKFELKKANQRSEIRTNIAKAERELAIEQEKVRLESYKISTKAQLDRLKQIEKDYNAAEKEAAVKYYLRGGLTSGIDLEVLTLKKTLQNFDELESFYYFESMSNGVTNILNNRLEEIDKFTTEKKALTSDERKEAYKNVKQTLAKSVLNIFGNGILYEPSKLNQFKDVLNGIDLPRNENDFYAMQIINKIYNNIDYDIQKFTKSFQPSTRQTQLEKERTITNWNNLIDLAENIDPTNLDQMAKLNALIKDFEKQPSSLFITADMRKKANDSLTLLRAKETASNSVMALSSNDVNNLELLNLNQMPRNFDANDLTNKNLLKVSAKLKNSGADITKINTYLSNIKQDKKTNEINELETTKKVEINSALATGVKNENYSDEDHRKGVDNIVIEIGKDEIFKQMNASPELNNLINTFGSNIIMDTYKDIISGNTLNISNDVITEAMTNYATNSKIRRDEKTPLINNYVTQGYLTQSEADKLDLMLLLKQQKGMETRSYAELSVLIDSSTSQENLTIEYSNDGSSQDRLKKVNARQLLLLSMGASSRSLRKKPPAFAQVINPSQAEKNYITKYEPIIKTYMAAGLGADAIINHFSKKFKDEYEMESEFVFEDNGINNFSNIRKNQKFKTQYPIGNYFQTEDETNWYLGKIENNLNTQGFTLYADNTQYERVVLKPYIKTDSPIQIFNPYKLTDNNVLEPAYYNLRVSSQQDPDETEGLTDTEIIIPHFPTNFRELYEYRAEQKEKIRNKMSEEILSGVGENQKMKFGMHLYRGFVFGTTATIPGKK